MKQLNLKPYDFGYDGQEGKKESISIIVQDELSDLILNIQLQLNGPALLENHKVSTKIKEETKDYILLEETEYQVLVNSLTTIKGFSEARVELVRRVLEAEDYDVNAEGADDTTS